MFVPEPIPQDRRSANFKSYLRRWAEDITAVRKSHPEVLHGIAFEFYFLCFYWLMPREQHNASYIEKHKLIESTGFAGERIKGELEQVLVEDQHLRDCCDTTLNLAYLVDHFEILPLIQAEKLTDDEYDKLFLRFTDVVYSQPFRKMTLSHLYNFVSPEKIMSFGNIKIMRLEPSHILDVIQDRSVYNFLHNHQTGDFFAITESGGAVSNVVEWIFDERAVAQELVWILQYYKDGIVDIDYTTPFFLPEWVNAIRKQGLAYIGEPRKLVYADGTRFYSLSQAEATEVNRWWQIYQTPQVTSRFEDLKNKLRQALLRAGDYYEASMQQKDPVGRLINLAIALEALFSPSDKTEVSYKISLSASSLVSDDANQRVENFNFLREMYKRRSALFHGTYDIDKDLLSVHEAERLAAIIRVSILRFLVLYLKGEGRRENILNKLSDGILNVNILDELRLESDPRTFIEQFQLPSS
jgi:Apea-like HEPN